MEGRDNVEKFLSESHGHVGRALERWVGLLASEEELGDLPEAMDVRLKAEEFQNYAQQMENAVLSLAISVEELAIERARRLRDPNRATTPDAAEALTALQDRDGEARGMTPEEPTLLAESRELESGSDDEEKSGGDDPLAGIPLTSYSQQDYAREAPGRATVEEGQMDEEGLLAGSSESNESTESKKCNCKKSRCLKLYCECFSSGIFCEGACMCRECLNVVQFTSLVTETRQHIIDRSPNAFAPKVSTDGGHKKGCHCKKSRCLKKYCECYQANVPCTDACRCENCMNSGPNAPRDESPQESSFFDGGAPHMPNADNKTNGSQGKQSSGGQQKQNSGGNASNANGGGATQSRRLHNAAAAPPTLPTGFGFQARPPAPQHPSRPPLHQPQPRPAAADSSGPPPEPPSRAPLQEPADLVTADSVGAPQPIGGQLPKDSRVPTCVSGHPSQQVFRTVYEGTKKDGGELAAASAQLPRAGGSGLERWSPATQQMWSQVVCPQLDPDKSSCSLEQTRAPGLGREQEAPVPRPAMPHVLGIPLGMEDRDSQSVSSGAGAPHWSRFQASLPTAQSQAAGSQWPSEGHANSHPPHAPLCQNAAQIPNSLHAQRDTARRSQTLVFGDWLVGRGSDSLPRNVGTNSAASGPCSHPSEAGRSVMPAVSDITDDATSPPPPSMVPRRRTNPEAPPPAKAHRTMAGLEHSQRYGVGRLHEGQVQQPSHHHMQLAQGYPVQFAQGQAAAHLELQARKLQGSQANSLAARTRQQDIVQLYSVPGKIIGIPESPLQSVLVAGKENGLQGHQKLSLQDDPSAMRRGKVPAGGALQDVAGNMPALS